MGNPARERKRGAPCGTMARYGEMNFALLFAVAGRHVQGTMQGMKQGKMTVSSRCLIIAD